MVAINTSQKISNIFLRDGQVPTGSNPDAKPSLDEITLTSTSIPDALSRKLINDDVFSLSESYGDCMAGYPSTFDFVKVTKSVLFTGKVLPTPDTCRKNFHRIQSRAQIFFQKTGYEMPLATQSVASFVYRFSGTNVPIKT